MDNFNLIGTFFDFSIFLITSSVLETTNQSAL